MRAVLTSIQPPNTDNIFNELKSIEWRTKPMPLGKHYCYETKNGGGTGKIIGQFIITGISRFTSVEVLPEILIALGCVTREQLKEYQKGRELYAHWIEEPIRYRIPIELKKFSKYGFGHRVPLQRPPQSWCYVESGVVE